MLNWISVDDRTPLLGEPVLLYGNDEVQHVTYILKGDNVTQWFEPYHFESDLIVKLKYVESWCYVRDVPTP